MLPVSSGSSIQRRRILHRRQQSLESPIMAPTNLQHIRRTHPGRPRHRHGLSLDNELQAMITTTGPHLLTQQDSNGVPSAPMPFDRNQQPLDTNIAYSLDQQHCGKQETQAHSTAKPGHPSSAASLPPAIQHAQDFQSHLQQLNNGSFNTAVASASAEQVAAMQDLQKHFMWYQQNRGDEIPTSMPGVPFVPMTMAAASNVHLGTLGAATPMVSIPDKRAPGRMMPIASQAFPETWTSPVSTHAHPHRPQGFQLETAPMSQPQDTSSQLASQSFSTASYAFTDSDHASSVYSSSVADPSSPVQHHATPLPTLFEEPCAPAHVHRAMMADPLLIPNMADGVEHDFNSPHFIVGAAPGMCPEQAALDAAGIEADYIDPGISDEELFSYLNAPINKGDPYTCKFEGCDARVNRKENARSHVQNHLNIRPWHCRLCDKAFCRMHDTKRHHLTHTQERPAVCPCGKTFARADALTRHRQRDMCEGVLPGFEKLEKDKPKRGRPKKDRSQDANNEHNNSDSRLKRRTQRPNMEMRIQKAHLSRSLEHANTHQASSHFGSDMSDMSDRSMPNTPPVDSDAMTAADFLHLDDADAHFASTGRAWNDTPPTSPHLMSHVMDSAKLSSDRLFIGLGSIQSARDNNPMKQQQPQPSRASSPVSTPYDIELPSAHVPSSTTGPSPLDWPSSSTAELPSSCGGFMGESSPIDSTADLFSDDFHLLSAHPGSGDAHDVFSPPGESCSGSSIYHSDFDAIHASRGAKSGANTAANALLNNNFEETATGYGTGMNGALGDEDGELGRYNDGHDFFDDWMPMHV